MGLPKKISSGAKPGAKSTARSGKKAAKPKPSAATRVRVEPPILAPGATSSQLDDVQELVNAARARAGLPPIEYMQPGDSLSKIRFADDGAAIADQGLGSGRSMLDTVSLPGGGKGFQQKTALQQFLDVILRQKSTARTGKGVQYDPATGRRSQVGLPEDSTLRPDHGRAAALLQSLFSENPLLARAVKDEFDSLPPAGKQAVYEAIAAEFPNNRTQAMPGGAGRIAEGWSPLAEDVVNVLHDGEWNPARLAEADRVEDGGAGLPTARVAGDGGEEAYRVLPEGDDLLEMSPEERLPPPGQEEWAPPDPEIQAPNKPPSSRRKEPVDPRFVRTRRGSHPPLHGERGSEANKPLDDRFQTTIVNLPRKLPTDLRALRAQLEALARDQFLSGGGQEAIQPNSALGRYMDQHVRSMTIKELQDFLDSKGISYPQDVASLPATAPGTRPTPIRVMGPVSAEEAGRLHDPKTYSQIRAWERYERLRELYEQGDPRVPEEPQPPRIGRPDEELTPETRTPQEQFDRALDQFLYSDNERLRRSALERLWRKMQTKNATTLLPSQEGSGILGKTADEQIDNFLTQMLSTASPGAADNISPVTREAARQLIQDHYWSGGRANYLDERADLKSAAKESRARKPKAEDEDGDELPVGLTGDPYKFTRMPAIARDNPIVTSAAELAEAKVALAQMQRQLASKFGTPEGKVLGKQVAQLRDAIKQYESAAGPSSPQPKRGLRRPGKQPAPEQVSAEPLQEKIDEAAAVEVQPEAEQVTARGAPKPRPQAVPKAPRKPVAARHSEMKSVAANPQRSAEEAQALQDYIAELVNGSSKPATKKRLDEILEQVEASRAQQEAPAEPPTPAEQLSGMATPRKAADADAEPATPEPATEDAPKETPEGAPAAPRDQTPVPRDDGPDEPIDNLESASAPEVSEPPKPSGDSLGELVPANRDLSAPGRPREVDGEWEYPSDADPDVIDVEFEVRPRDTDMTAAPRLPGPESEDATAASPGRRFPWKRAAAVAAATLGGGALVNAIRQGLYNTGIDPFFPVDGRRRQGEPGAESSGQDGAMSAAEMASRKPFHALSPEERIRFLRSRVAQPIPSTMTRPY